MNLTPPPPTTPSFEKSAKPLLLALKPSRTLGIALLILHLLALFAIAIAAVPAVIKILLCVFVLVSLFFQVKNHQRTEQLVWRTGNRWFINEDETPAELTAVNFFSRWLVIVSLIKPVQPQSGLSRLFPPTSKFIIPFDALDENTFRLLRVRLRIEAHGLLNPSEETIQ